GFREPIILIAGGRNKGIDLEPLAQAIARRVTGLVTMGETGDELARRVRDAGLDRVERAADLSDAVRKAAALARPGSVVLLSPAFTSYGMFSASGGRGRGARRLPPAATAGLAAWVTQRRPADPRPPATLRRGGEWRPPLAAARAAPDAARGAGEDCGHRLYGAVAGAPPRPAGLAGK